MARRPFTSLSLLAGALLVASVVVGANCKSKDAPAPLGGSPVKTDAAARPPDDGLTEEEATKLIPGIVTSDLSPKQRSELVDFANDTFCPCAGMTAAGCLRERPTCKPAARMVNLGKKLILNGYGGPMALVRVETYYASFANDRRKTVAAEGQPQGPESAPVTIVEFSDFQCPACRAAHPVLEEVVKKYAGSVRWVFRNFPLPQHDRALKAAQCGAWAAKQGKFWPMSEELFSHQDELDDAGLVKVANGIGLNGAAMLKAVNADPSYAALVEKDKSAGTDLGVVGTPAIFINGRQFVGFPPSLEMLSWTIEDELEWLGNGGAWAASH